MDVFEAIRGRRSIRRFRDTPVLQDKIEVLLDAARWAPSACNRQLWEFAVVTDKEVKKRLARTTGVASYVLNAPVAIVVFYDNRFNLEYHANIQSAAMAVENILLAAKATGLGSICVADIRDMIGLRAVVGAPTHLDAVSIVLIGYPDEEPTPPSRRPVSRIMHMERFSETVPLYPDSIFPSRWKVTELREYQKYVCRAGPREIDFYPAFHHSIAALLSESLRERSGLKTLDIFSYGGGFLVDIARICQDVTVCEMSTEVANFSGRKIAEQSLSGRVAYVVGDGMTLPFKDETFDTATCVLKLEHHPNPKEILSEIFRVLTPEGRLILAVRNALSLHGVSYWYKVLIRGKSLVGDYYPLIGPYKPYRSTTVLAMLRKAGFARSKVVGINLVSPRRKTNRSANIRAYTSFLKHLTTILLIAADKNP